MSERIAVQKINELLVNIRASAWRLETLNQYALTPAAQKYIAGERDFEDPSMAKWLVTLKGIIGSGRDRKDYGRVHVIPASLTPYLEYEIFDGYKRTSAVGERIALLEGDPVGVFQGLEWPQLDFWIFDEDTVLLMNYDSEGNAIDAVKSTEPELLKQCLAVRDRAEKLATPWAEYVAKHAAQELA